MKITESMWESTKSVTTCTFECESATIKITALLWSLIQWLQNSTHMCFRLTNDNKSVQDAMGGKFTGVHFKYIGPFCVYLFIIHSVKQKSSVKNQTLVYESAEVRRNPATAARERKRWKMDPKSSSLSEATDCHYWSHGGLGVYLPEHFDRQKQNCCVKNQGSYKLWQHSRCLPDFSKPDLF